VGHNEFHHCGKEISTSIKLYYKDWGSGQPVVFAMAGAEADAWDDRWYIWQPADSVALP